MLNVSFPPWSMNFDILLANFSALTGIKGKRTDCIISFDILIISSSESKKKKKKIFCLEEEDLLLPEE